MSKERTSQKWSRLYDELRGYIRKFKANTSCWEEIKSAKDTNRYNGRILNEIEAIEVAIRKIKRRYEGKI